MDFDDAKIWNARFTLLHVAIQELAQLRMREYDALEYRVKVLESRNEKISFKTRFRDVIYGFVGGVFGAMFFVALIYFFLIKD